MPAHGVGFLPGDTTRSNVYCRREAALRAGRALELDRYSAVGPAGLVERARSVLTPSAWRVDVASGLSRGHAAQLPACASAITWYRRCGRPRSSMWPCAVGEPGGTCCRGPTWTVAIFTDQSSATRTCPPAGASHRFEHRQHFLVRRDPASASACRRDRSRAGDDAIGRSIARSTPALLLAAEVDGRCSAAARAACASSPPTDTSRDSRRADPRRLVGPACTRWVPPFLIVYSLRPRRPSPSRRPRTACAARRRRAPRSIRRA